MVSVSNTAPRSTAGFSSLRSSVRLAGQYPGRLALAFLVLLIGIAFCAPYSYLGRAAVVDGVPWQKVLSWSHTLQPIGNSLGLAAAVAVASTALGVSTAFAVTKLDLPGRRFLRVALPIPLVMPSFVGATALIAATSRGGFLSWVPTPFGFWGAFGTLTILTYPYVFLPVAARLSSTSPTLEEAARTLGKGRWSTICCVVLPQLKNSAIAGALLVFLYTLSEFGAVAVLRFNTITQTIFASRISDRQLSLSLGLFLALIAVSVAALASTRAEDGRRVSSKPPIKYDIGWYRWLVAALCAAPVIVGVVIPVVVFVEWTTWAHPTSGSSFTGWGNDVSFLTEPVIGSTVTALAAAVVTTAVTLPVAVLTIRRRSKLGRWVSVLIAASFAIPGLVVALALTVWAVRAPFGLDVLYQTFALMVLGYVVHFGAQSLRSTESAVASVPKTYSEAAATLGASWWRRLTKVEGPLMRRGIQAGAGLVLLSTLKELPATLLLAPPGFATLATQIWSSSSEAFFAEAGAASLVLLVLSATLTWLLVLRKADVD